MTCPLVEIHATEADWLEARRKSIGGSGILDLLGIEIDGREPRGLWWLWLHHSPQRWETIGQDGRDRYREIETSGFNVNLAARSAMEPVIQAWAEEENEISIFDPRDYCILRHPEDPRKHCSPDGLVFSKKEMRPFMARIGRHYKRGEWKKYKTFIEEGFLTGGLNTFAEYKTVSPFARHHWTPQEPSLHALMQSVWYMGVTGFDHARVFGQVGFGDAPHDRLSYVVERNDELLGLMDEAFDEFWKHVDNDTEPPVDGFSKTTQAIRLLYRSRPKKEARMVSYASDSDEGAKIISASDELKLIKGQLDTLGRRKEQLRQEIEVEMGHLEADNLIISAPDRAVTWARQEISPKDTRCPHCKEVTTKRKPHTTLTGPKES